MFCLDVFSVVLLHLSYRAERHPNSLGRGVLLKKHHNRTFFPSVVVGARRTYIRLKPRLTPRFLSLYRPPRANRMKHKVKYIQDTRMKLVHNNIIIIIPGTSLDSNKRDRSGIGYEPCRNSARAYESQKRCSTPRFLVVIRVTRLREKFGAYIPKSERYSNMPSFRIVGWI